MNGEHLPGKPLQLKFAAAGGTNYVSASEWHYPKRECQWLLGEFNLMSANGYLENLRILSKLTPTATFCVTLTTEMNTLQILNILKNDPFTKSVFTDVLPSDRLPNQIQKKPRGFILNVDPSNGPGTHWIAIYFTADGKR